MLKQIVLLLIASILIVLFSAYGALVLHWIGTFYQFIDNLLSHVISNGSTGKIVRSVIELLAIPIIIGYALNGIYLVIMRREYPYLYCSIWFIWLILVVTAIVA